MEDPLEPFRAEVLAELARALHAAGVPGGFHPSLAIPPKDRPADFAYPVFPAAAQVKRPPAPFAGELAAAIRLPPHFQPAEATGPFLNFRVQDRALVHAVLREVMQAKAAYGTHPSTGRRIILEHTSANPTGPFHVGRARNPIIGDSLARILRRAGETVEVQYWVNDVGKQIAVLAWGVRRLTPADVADRLQRPPEHEGESREKDDHRLVPYYQEAAKRLEERPEVAAEIADWLRKLEAGDPATTKLVRDSCERMLAGMRATLRRLRAETDRYVYESETLRDGSAVKVIADLKTKEHAKEEDGAWYLDMAALGVQGKERFFFTRADGTSLYPTRDVAYHLGKLARCDVAIDILGEDHRLEAQQLRTALQLLGAPRLPEAVFYSFVRLPEGRMSTRRGRVVYVDDLLDEALDRAVREVEARRPELAPAERQAIAEVVGIGAIRYNIVRVQAEKDFVFSWEEALALEGNSAPYLQYAHARCAAILRKAAEEGVSSSGWTAEDLTTGDERALAWQIGLFPGLVRRAAEERRPHIVCGLLHELVMAYNQFYTNVPVLRSPQVSSRLALVEATMHTLAAGLDCLGIVAPDRM